MNTNQEIIGNGWGLVKNLIDPKVLTSAGGVIIALFAIGMWYRATLVQSETFGAQIAEIKNEFKREHDESIMVRRDLMQVIEKNTQAIRDLQLFLRR